MNKEKIKKQNKLLITIGATIGIITIILIIVALVIVEGLRVL